MTGIPLFAKLIDYAGVFPPASLDVLQARDRYVQAAASDDGWLLGPMLLRASQVTEYLAPECDTRSTVPLGVIVDQPFGPDAPPLVQVERRTDPADAAATIETLHGLAPVAYVESSEPNDLSFLTAIDEARRTGHDVRAKIRTGGATAAAFPSSEAVAAFIATCVDLGIPFKATAGLHHPVRHLSAVDDAVEHGFINMLSAVRCALSDQPERTVECLNETDPGAFDMATATWRGVGADVPVETLRGTFRSIGSCSFTEPAGYLRDLGVI